MNKSAIVAFSLAAFSLLLLGCDKTPQVSTRAKPFQPPEFSGEFHVATKAFQWTDETREESFTEVTGDKREIGVRLYYPTDDITGHQHLALLPPGFADYYLDFSPVDEQTLILSHFDNNHWPIAINAILSQTKQQFPLIIFSHGYYLLPELHTFLAAELASHGYIVASINHTYGSSYAKLKNGVVTGAVDHNEEDMGAYHQIWSRDQLFTLGKVRQLTQQEGSGYVGKLSDFVAIVGHSYGGASGYHTATMTNDIDAVVNMDGRIFDLDNTSISTPFMYVHSESEYQADAFQHIHAQGYSTVFAGLHHNSFSDLPLYWEWDYPGQTFFGDMKHKNPQQVVAQSILAFFQSLNNSAETNPLLEMQNKALQIDVIAYPPAKGGSKARH